MFDFFLKIGYNRCIELKSAGEYPLFYWFIINLNRHFCLFKAKNVKNKTMDDEKKCPCPDCEKRAEQDQKQEEMGFAVLVALVPMLTLTVFSTLGLF